MGSWQTLTETSLGTGVARTEIDAATSKPSPVKELVEFVPYMALNGIPTTVESVSAQIELISNSIDLLPKVVIVPPIEAGLSTLIPTLVPILESYPCHTPVEEKSTQQMQAFGTCQVANTVAPLLGDGLHWSTINSGKPQMFYDKPANETNTGTAATTVSGNTIQVNAGKVLQSAYFAAVYVTPTAGDPFIGDFTISSNDFDDPMPLEMPQQPVGQFLGATAGTFLPKLTSYHNLSKGMKDSCLIATSARFGVAQAATGTFIHGVGYQKVK